MKKSCQIAVLALAALVAASPFNCPPAATVTVTYRGGIQSQLQVPFQSRVLHLLEALRLPVAQATI